MPRRPKDDGLNCPMCQTAGASLDPVTASLCRDHYDRAVGRLERVLKEEFGSSYTTMMSCIVDLGAERRLLTPVIWHNAILRRVSQRLPGLVARSPNSRFNSTQALKRFCRQKYKENPSLNKPPKNSASKMQFVQWAIANGVDISQFRTRAYTRRSAGDGSGEWSMDSDEEEEEMEEDDEETAAAQLTAAAGVERAKSPAPASKPASPSSSTSGPIVPAASAAASAAAALPPVSSFGSFHPAQYSPLLFMHPGLGMLTPSGQHFSIPFVPQMAPVHMPSQPLSKDAQPAAASSSAAPASSN
eukprot:TRINITY_DN3413_c0_g1_i1.p1 TRINITY_DN3413_c0_g1~~TRINITY_DN3413_c0_g1_i1.p1  ORF type:complete len:301 (+),score=70.91 TRINITY_DN3413_c0_g1_i1:88-990(+)